MSERNDETTAITWIDIERSIDDVWWSMVESSRLSRWMGPGSQIQPWLGGEIRVPDTATGVAKRGRVDAVEPRKRLEFEWWPEAEDGQDDDDGTQTRSRVAFELAVVPGGTRVTVTETSVGSVRSATASAALSAASDRPLNLAALQAASLWRLTLLAVAVKITRPLRTR